MKNRIDPVLPEHTRHRRSIAVVDLMELCPAGNSFGMSSRQIINDYYRVP
jgi:hypothetical protein